jgi:hypothetical protein
MFRTMAKMSPAFDISSQTVPDEEYNCWFLKNKIFRCLLD